MSYRAILVTALMLFAVSLYGQKAPIKFGKIDPEEVKMTEYAADPSAEAVVLVDYGVTSVQYNQGEGFFLLFTRHRRIKVLTKDGYDWADHEVHLYRDRNDEETIQGVKGLTYNMDGGKSKSVKLSKKSIFKEKTNDNWETVKFTMPNVKEGSVIEYTYSVRSPFYSNLQDWYFQTSIPTIWSEYMIRIPEYFKYEMLMQGYHPMSVNTSDRQNDRITLSVADRGSKTDINSKSSFSTETVNYMRFDNRWVAKNVPAFREEPYMSNYENYLSQVSFELAYTQFPGGKRNRYMGTWMDINNTYTQAQFFGGQMNNTPAFKDQVSSIVQGASNDKDKANKIADFVRNHMSWNGNYRRLASDDLRRSFQAKEGSSADINLMLVNMFRKAGLNADGVLVSTRSNGMVRERFPLSSQFNYMIAAVELANGEVMLFDATDKMLPNNLLPERCINGNGWRVSKTKPGWVDLTQNTSKSTNMVSKLALTTEGVLSGTTDMHYEGYAAHRIRASHKEKGDGFEEYMAGQHGWQIEKSQLDKVDELNQPVDAHFEIKTSNGLEVLGELVYLNPFVGDQMEENPFKLDQRAFPVDFVTPSNYTYDITLSIPDGYAVESLPEAVELELPEKGGTYSYAIKQSGGEINMKSKFNLSRAIFSGPEYQRLKSFFAKMVEKQAEQIVLKKK